VTGRRPGRGAPGDPWRGGRPGGEPSERRPIYHPDSNSGPAELEELPAQPVLARGSSRLGIGGAVAVAGMAALLAMGFGLLGGRPEPSAVPSAAAVQPTQAPPFATPVVVVPEPEPAVTPWTECGDPVIGLPTIELQVDGEPYPAAVLELIDPAEVVEPYPTSRPGAGSGPRPSAASEDAIEVLPGLITEIWIDGGSCALSWRIEVVGQGFLEEFINHEADPAWARQNRFQVDLTKFEGAQTIAAAFDFDGVAIRTTWPIVIPPIPVPTGMLRDEDGDVIPLTLGCNAHQSLANQFDRLLNECPDHVASPLEDPVPVQQGSGLAFSAGEWLIDGAGLDCGQLETVRFFPIADSACTMSPARSTPEAWEFELPAGLPAGEWAIAISACPSLTVDQLSNTVCATWYAAVEVSD
jgi:hypothetical protein